MHGHLREGGREGGRAGLRSRAQRCSAQAQRGRAMRPSLSPSVPRARADACASRACASFPLQLSCTVDAPDGQGKTSDTEGTFTAVLCTLTPGVTDQFAMNLIFNDAVTFTITGVLRVATRCCCVVCARARAVGRGLSARLRACGPYPHRTPAARGRTVAAMPSLAILCSYDTAYGH